MIMSFSSVLVESLHKTHTVSFLLAPLSLYMVFSRTPASQNINGLMRRELFLMCRNIDSLGGTRRVKRLWRDNNAPRWTAGQLRACSVVPDIMAACNDRKHLSKQGSFPSLFSNTAIRFERLLCVFCFRVIHVEELINMIDFIKRKMPVFIFLGSFTAVIFFFFFHYCWTICCSVTIIPVRSIKCMLLRTVTHEFL